MKTMVSTLAKMRVNTGGRIEETGWQENEWVAKQKLNVLDYESGRLDKRVGMSTWAVVSE